MSRLETLARLKREAEQAENRRAAVAVYGDKTTENYRRLAREAEGRWSSYYEVKHRTA